MAQIDTARVTPRRRGLLHPRLCGVRSMARPWRTTLWIALLLGGCSFNSMGLSPGAEISQGAMDAGDADTGPQTDSGREQGLAADLPVQDLGADASPDLLTSDMADAHPSDVGKPDLNKADVLISDVLFPDVSISDLPAPSCVALFGHILDYHLCDQAWDRCRFFRKGPDISCDKVCGKHKCLGSYEADSGDMCKTKKAKPCKEKQKDANCTCSKYH